MILPKGYERWFTVDECWLGRDPDKCLHEWQPFDCYDYVDWSIIYCPLCITYCTTDDDESIEEYRRKYEVRGSGLPS